MNPTQKFEDAPTTLWFTSVSVVALVNLALDGITLSDFVAAGRDKQRTYLQRHSRLSDDEADLIGIYLRNWFEVAGQVRTDLEIARVAL